MRVLLTGAAGSIGRVVGPGLLAAGHQVVALDLLAPADPTGYERIHVGDVLDAQLVAQAIEGAHAVVHLAGNPGEDTLPASLASHVHSTGVLLDAMVSHGIRRIVYASSNHAVGLTPSGSKLTIDVRPRPDTFYGVAKVAAEALLSLYSDRHGIDAFAMRIGSFLDQPTTRRQQDTWLSHRDCIAMVQALLTTSAHGFHVLYGISANASGWWDPNPGRALGYHPVDNGSIFADQIPDRPEDAQEQAHVGGPFAV